MATATYWIVGYIVFAMSLLIANILVWRKQMSTSAELLTTASSLAAAANALTATASAVSALVTSLKAGGGASVVDQATLDSVNTSLASSLTAVQSAQASLQALVPTPPAP